MLKPKALFTVMDVQALQTLGLHGETRSAQAGLRGCARCLGSAQQAPKYASKLGSARQTQTLEPDRRVQPCNYTGPAVLAV